jgi:hypothetical protein
MDFHTEFMWSIKCVLVILEIFIDNFLSKQDLSMYIYLYWRRLLNGKNIDVKKITVRINTIII